MNRPAAAKTATTLGIIVSILAILGVLASIARDQGAMQAKLDATAQDVAMIKAKLIPDAKTAQRPDSPWIENADGPAEAVAIPEGGWHAAYLSDHCRHCPECCPKLSGEAWP